MKNYPYTFSHYFPIFVKTPAQIKDPLIFHSIRPLLNVGTLTTNFKFPYF